MGPRNGAPLEGPIGARLFMSYKETEGLCCPPLYLLVLLLVLLL